MKLTYFLAAALVLASTGCSKNQKQADSFFPDPSASSVRKFERSQTARGARDDGMLYARHFDGEKLNSLGRQKLGLILADDSGDNTMKIYLVNLGAGDLLERRKGAIAAYLKDALSPSEKVEFINGANPNALHPSAETLANMSKLQTGDGAQTDQPQIPMMGSATK